MSHDRADPDVRRRRCALALLLTEPSAFAGELGEKMLVLATRYNALLAGLERLGCFFLRRGAIESYSAETFSGASKPAWASAEAERLAALPLAQLATGYPELVRALRCAAPGRNIDESILLRGKLAAALGAIFQTMEIGSTDAQIVSMALSVLPAIRGLFTFHNATNVDQPAVRVKLLSNIFNLTGFPLTVAINDNLNDAVGQIKAG